MIIGHFHQLLGHKMRFIITKQGVCHTAALPIYIKMYFKAKEELWKIKDFTFQIYNLQKNPLKETQSPSQHIITLV